MSVVAIEGLTKRYAGAVTALHGIDLTVESGEDLVILGPSGSGKSTLLHIMGALERPTSGRVRIAGLDIAAAGDGELAHLRGRFLGFVFQQAHLIPHLTATQNVALGLRYAGVPRCDRVDLAHVALDRVGLSHRLAHLPGALSGGERQRVGIARAIAVRPALLLADEPTGALDRRTGGEILDLFRTLHEDGTTIAVITHDPTVAAAFSRRVEIRDGHLTGSAA